MQISLKIKYIYLVLITAIEKNIGAKKFQLNKKKYLFSINCFPGLFYNTITAATKRLLNWKFM